ncbi:MAG: HAMP domain-containing histidine kinase [Planctomycetia bacterium]|nr:HAMP domain-containing histidine kinase [Planctomycetia bacterium]
MTPDAARPPSRRAVTLRARFTVWTTALVWLVLFGAFVPVAALERDVALQGLADRARRLARAHAPSEEELRGTEPARPPPPPPPPPAGGAAGNPPDPLDPPDRPEPPRPIQTTTTPLPDETDGAHVEVLHVDPGPRGEGPLRILWRRGTGEARVAEPDLRALDRWIEDGSAHGVRVAGRGGREDGMFTVAVRELGVPNPPRPLRGPGGRPGPGRPRRGQGTFAVAFVEEAPMEAALLRRRGTLLLVVTAAAALGGFLSFLLAGRLLRPLRRAADDAEAIASPEARLPAPPADDEVGRLVAVLNGMLGRLDASAGRERQFLASASHELRRPLASLLGELELAATPGRSPDALREAVRLARSDALAMQRLVDDLLHHARARAGQLPLVARDVALPDLVAEAVARSRRALGRADADVDAAGVADLLLHVDADALRQVVENLVSNALTHAGPDAHVVVTAAREGDGVVLAVEDDGPGIPVDEQTRVFEPFGRGDRARAAPGFGLGLAIAREVARALGGRLEVRSPLRGADAARPGTRFTLRLPPAALAAGGGPAAPGPRPPA